MRICIKSRLKAIKCPISTINGSIKTLSGSIGGRSIITDFSALYDGYDFALDGTCSIILSNFSSHVGKKCLITVLNNVVVTYNNIAINTEAGTFTFILVPGQEEISLSGGTPEEAINLEVLALYTYSENTRQAEGRASNRIAKTYKRR